MDDTAETRLLRTDGTVGGEDCSAPSSSAGKVDKEKIDVEERGITVPVQPQPCQVRSQ